MFKTLLSLFKKPDTKPPQAGRKVQTPKPKPKVALTRIGELGEHKINLQLEQLPKECKALSDLLIPNPSAHGLFSGGSSRYFSVRPIRD
ncbi:hypothetical protein [Paenibacillus sonchi]|uniref:hypothetical protein n=1 Tax=Paenibacillus sonchi TaxID=373687 RepID=UPI001F1E0B4D|nr:hypothetical protein [Paenibacillus sonchi]